MTKVRPILQGGMLHGSPVTATRAAPPDRTRPRPGLATHEYATVMFYTGGRARVEQNGHWTLAAGDVLLVPAGEAHRMLELRRAEYWGLTLAVPCFAAEGSTALLEPIERVRDGASAVVHVPASRHQFLDSLFRELEAVEARSPACHGPIRTSLLTLILAEIDRGGLYRAAVPRSSGVVVDALRFIERNCLRRLTVEDVALAVKRSPTYVTTALTKATGRSAIDWIVGGRMAEARRLLLHSDERVDIVAERVGYADATHFIRMFRRVHGATPTAWRAAQGRRAAFTAPSRLPLPDSATAARAPQQTADPRSARLPPRSGSDPGS